MDISTARKDLAKLVGNLPAEGIPIERYGKVVALLVRPEYVPEAHWDIKPVDEPKVLKTRTGAKTLVDRIEQARTNVEGVWSQLPEEFKNSVALTKERQKAKDDLLRRINRG